MEAKPHGSTELIASESAWFRIGGSGHVLHLLLRVVFGAVFLYAGYTKGRDPSAFVSDLRGFRVFPEIMVLPLGAYVPFLEILVGCALIFGFWYSGALLLAACLLIMFDAVIVSAMWRGIDIVCGCFGHGMNTSIGMALLRDCGLLVILGLLTWLFVKRSTQETIKEPLPLQ
jgi:putative oxidoreductase